jgi:hypothetical protein
MMRGPPPTRTPPLREEEEEEDEYAQAGGARRGRPRPATATTTTAPDPAAASLSQVLSSPPRALALFAAEDFDPDAFVAEAFRSLTERGIDNARRDLDALLTATRGAVAEAAADHHASFLELCQGAEELRGGVQMLRGYVSGANALAGRLRADLKPLHSLTRRALAPPMRRRRSGGGKGRRRTAGNDDEEEQANDEDQVDDDDDDDEEEEDDDDDDEEGDQKDRQQSLLLDPTAGAGAAAAAATAAAAAAAMQGFGGGKLSERARRIERDLTALLRQLDEAVAQRDVARALAALSAGDDAAAVLDRDAGTLALEVEDLPAWRYHLEASLAARRRALTRSLERQLEDGGAAGAEARAAARALAALAGDGPAASAVLGCHSARLRAAAAMQLRAQASHWSAADPDGLEYVGALVQGALAEVGAAADALAAVFGARSSAAAAAFSVWSAREARACAALLRRHALAQSSGGGGVGSAGMVVVAAGAGAAAVATTPTTITPELEPAARALSVALVFCAVLERSHQVSLAAVFERALAPDVEAALRRRLRRAADEAAVAAAEEGEALVMARLVAGGDGGAGGRGDNDDAAQQQHQQHQQHQQLQVVELVTASGLLGELAAASRLLAPLLRRLPALAAALREGAVAAFTAYTRAALRPLRAHAGFSPDDRPRLAPLLPALLEALAGVAETIAPAMAAPLQVAAAGGGGSDADAAAVVDVARALDAALAAAYGQAQAAMRAS